MSGGAEKASRQEQAGILLELRGRPRINYPSVGDEPSFTTHLVLAQGVHLWGLPRQLERDL